MKIAIVGPSPVPFTIGGVENLLWGLINTINQETVHQAELIKLPSRENDFWSIIDTYKSFYNLDLSYFDMVISTKYPAWMVQHDNHICYLQHRLRGLYDTYHFCKLPVEVKRGNREIDKILKYMEENENPKNLDKFFELLDDLYKVRNNINKDYFSFPGPFIKKVVTYMDDFALSDEKIKNFYCISKTVQNRKEYFPNDIIPKVVHHPSFLKNFSSNEYKYIFIVSRLDSPKRIDLLINAMRYVNHEIDLIIAGTGPQEEYLKSIAKDDKRIKFVGFVNDEGIEAYYRDALVVPYFPYDEDYGLITIEAMMNRKPVITTFDAGGPTEFVEDYKTGFITRTEPQAIAEKINYLIENKDEAKKMGQNAYLKVKDIEWLTVVNNILNENNVKKHKKTITLTSTFPIYPATGGGQIRTYNLCKNLSDDFNIEIVSLVNTNVDESHNYIYNSVREHCITKTEKHQTEEYKIEKKARIPVTDIVMPVLNKYTPKYTNTLNDMISKSDIVVLSHPYMYEEVIKYIGDKVLIYDAQDVEYKIKKEMLTENKHKQIEELVQNIYELEKKCCEKSKFIMACSEEDKRSLSQLYSVPLEKILVVPNGVDIKNTTFTSIDVRNQNKEKLGLRNEKIGLFMGSWHGPNLEACEEIFKIAEKCPDVKFMLMGSQCMYFKDKQIPSNVGLLGLVSEEQKNKIFSIVDFALNPMLSGSGTNLKMFDYMAAGIPIITTEFGTRGIENKDIFIIDEIENMDKDINKFDIQSNRELIINSREYVKKNFDWKVIVKNLNEQLIKNANNNLEGDED